MACNLKKKDKIYVKFVVLTVVQIQIPLFCGMMLFGWYFRKMANLDDSSSKLSGLAAIDASCAENLGCYKSLLVTNKEKCIKQTLEYITVRLLVGTSRRFE